MKCSCIVMGEWEKLCEMVCEMNVMVCDGGMVCDGVYDGVIV